MTERVQTCTEEGLFVGIERYRCEVVNHRNKELKFKCFSNVDKSENMKRTAGIRAEFRSVQTFRPNRAPRNFGGSTF